MNKIEKIVNESAWIFNPKMVAGAIAGIFILKAAIDLLDVARGVYPETGSKLITQAFVFLLVGLPVWIGKALQYKAEKQKQAKELIDAQQKGLYSVGRAYQECRESSKAIAAYKECISLQLYSPYTSAAEDLIKQIENGDKPE